MTPDELERGILLLIEEFESANPSARLRVRDITLYLPDHLSERYIRVLFSGGPQPGVQTSQSPQEIHSVINIPKGKPPLLGVRLAKV